MLYISPKPHLVTRSLVYIRHPSFPYKPNRWSTYPDIGQASGLWVVCLTCFGSCSKSHLEVWCIAVCRSSTASAGRTRTVERHNHEDQEKDRDKHKAQKNTTCTFFLYQTPSVFTSISSSFPLGLYKINKLGQVSDCVCYRQKFTLSCESIIKLKL